MAKRLMTLMVAVAAVAALAVFASACGDDDTQATATMEQPESSQPSRTWSWSRRASATCRRSSRL